MPIDFTEGGGDGGSSYSPPFPLLAPGTEPTEANWRNAGAAWTGDRWLRIARELIGSHGLVAHFALLDASGGSDNGREFVNELGGAAGNIDTMRTANLHGDQSYAVTWTATRDYEIGDLAWISGTSGTYYVCTQDHTAEAANGPTASGGADYWQDYSIGEVHDRANWRGVFTSRQEALDDGSVTAEGQWIISTESGVARAYSRLTGPDGWRFADIGNAVLHGVPRPDNASALQEVWGYDADNPQYYVINGGLKAVTFYSAPAAGAAQYHTAPPEEQFANILLELALGTPDAHKANRVRLFKGVLYRCVPRWGTAQSVTWTTYAEAADVGALWGLAADAYRWRGQHHRLGDVSTPGDDDVTADPHGAFYRYEGVQNPRGYRHLGHPDDWIGTFDEESDADNHVTKVDNVALVGGVLQQVTAFTPGSSSQFTWEPVRDLGAGRIGGRVVPRDTELVDGETISEDGTDTVDLGEPIDPDAAEYIFRVHSDASQSPTVEFSVSAATLDGLFSAGPSAANGDSAVAYAIGDVGTLAVDTNSPASVRVWKANATNSVGINITGTAGNLTLDIIKREWVIE